MTAQNLGQSFFICVMKSVKKAWASEEIFSMHYASERTARKKYSEAQAFFY